MLDRLTNLFFKAPGDLGGAFILGMVLGVGVSGPVAAICSLIVGVQQILAFHAAEPWYDVAGVLRECMFHGVLEIGLGAVVLLATGLAATNSRVRDAIVELTGRNLNAVPIASLAVCGLITIVVQICAALPQPGSGF
jgi:hypothetical protein